MCVVFLCLYICVCGYSCVSILLSLINFHSSLPSSLPTILPLLEFVYAYSIFIVLIHTHKRLHAGIRVLVWVRGRGRKGEGGSGDHAGRCTHLPSRPSSQSITRRGGSVRTEHRGQLHSNLSCTTFAYVAHTSALTDPCAQAWRRHLFTFTPGLRRGRDLAGHVQRGHAGNTSSCMSSDR